MSGFGATTTPDLLPRLSAFVSARMGLHFPPQRWNDLQRGLDSAAREFGFDNSPACIEWLESSPVTMSQMEVLASHLTVGETYFFREHRSFELLEQEVFPKLIESRRVHERRLRIWSAACCTGEEPYTVAMILRRLLPDSQTWDITILATDINPQFLRKASEGVFGEWSFRGAPAGTKDRYFEPAGNGQYRILPEIRRAVTFDYLNLAEDVYPSLLNNTNAMDVILCRNVLIYLSSEEAGKWVNKLEHSLDESGWLIVGAVETLHVKSERLALISFPGATFFQKQRKPQPVQPAEAIWNWPTPDSSASVLEKPDPPPVIEWQHNPFANALELYEAGRYVEAADELLTLVSHNPDAPPEQIALLARAYANQGRLADALAWCDKVIGGAKSDPALHYLRGTILQERGNIDEAKTSLKRAIYLDPEFVMAHFVLGHLLRQDGAPGGGAKYFQNALRLLQNCQPEQTLAQSEGLTAGRLRQIIAALSTEEAIS